MEPTQTLSVKSPLTSPNSFKHIGRKMMKFENKKSILHNNVHGKPLLFILMNHFYINFFMLTYEIIRQICAL